MKYINYINLRGKRSSITLTNVQLTALKLLCQLHGFKGPNEYIRMVLHKGIHGNISMAVRDWMLVELTQLLEGTTYEINQTNSRIH